MLESTQNESYFNCGTSYRWVTITISKKTICEACIIHNENEINLVFDWSSYKERKENALASGADEGRDKLR